MKIIARGPEQFQWIVCLAAIHRFKFLLLVFLNAGWLAQANAYSIAHQNIFLCRSVELTGLSSIKHAQPKP